MDRTWSPGSPAGPTCCSRTSVPACSTGSGSVRSSCSRASRGSSTARLRVGAAGTHGRRAGRTHRSCTRQVGLLELDGRLRGVEPRQEVHLHGDLYPGVLATSAVLAALFERERSGAGQHLDVSMAGALTYVNEWAAVELLGYDGPRAFDIWTHPVAQLGDGSLAALVGNPATSFATWIGALDGDAALLDDPRFSSRAAIEANVDAAVGVLRDLVGRIEHFEQLEEAIASTPLLVAEVRSVARPRRNHLGRRGRVVRRDRARPRRPAGPVAGLRRRGRGGRAGTPARRRRGRGARRLARRGRSGRRTGW